MGHPNDAYRRFHQRRYQTLTNLLARHLTGKTPRCLDIGSGGDAAGLVPLLRARFTDEVHTVDQGVDVAAGAAKGLVAAACDVDRDPLPYPDAHFGLVLFASVIEHLYHPRRVIAEIARVLAPGGLLLLEAPNAVALGRRLDALVGRNPFAVFNRFNAIEGEAPLSACAVFYTADEAAALLGGWFDVLERRYAMHQPPANPLKSFAREAVFRLWPAAADCFLIAARRREA